MKRFAKILAVALVCVMAVAMLAACTPNADPIKAKASLEKKGYKVIGTETVLGVGGLTYTIAASKTVENKDGSKSLESVTIYYYQAKENADSAFEKMKGQASETTKVGHAGKVVWVGTEQAIKDAA